MRRLLKKYGRLVVGLWNLTVAHSCLNSTYIMVITQKLCASGKSGCPERTFSDQEGLQD